MVYEVMRTKYNVFFESLILTLLIIVIGFSLGMFFEDYRNDKILESYKNYEVEALDLKLQSYSYQIMDKSACEEVINQNFIFADELYNRGLELERFEEANQITEDLLREKKRYVLLKTELWLDSVLLKQKCDKPFDTVVYFYSADPSNSFVVAQQKIISNTLKSVKEKKGNSIILLPIAGDIKISSFEGSPNLGIIELQKRIYNVTALPSILINEKTILEGYHSEEEILSYLTDKSDNSSVIYLKK